MADTVKHNVGVSLRLAPEMVVAISNAAAAKGQKPAEWMRQAFSSVLAIEALSERISQSPSAGALYDVIDGKRRFARIDREEVQAMGYHAKKPAEGDWRPVYHSDSEPFDRATKWRLVPPFVSVTADSVLVTYPVVDKSMEWA